MVVATNRPDVAKGIQRRDVIDAMHNRPRERLLIDDVRVCWCEEGPHCDCYKPKHGMLLSAAEKLGLDLPQSYMVGDRWRDVGCGRQAGCFTIFIERGHDEKLRDAPDATCRNLLEVVELIVQRCRSEA